MTASDEVGNTDHGLQTFFQPNEVPGDRSQRCPVCLQGMPFCERYPAYVCAPCAHLAVDVNGNPLEIILAGMMGGQAARGTGDDGTVVCFIGDVRCEVGEARFGGYVMQPAWTRPPPLPDVRRLKITQLLSLHSTVMDELRFRNVVRTGNNPTGDYVEWLVASRLWLTLEPNSTKGVDAVDEDGARYQIKGRRLAAANSPAQLGVIRGLEMGHFDYLVAVVMNADWSVRWAVKIPHAVIASIATFRKHVNGHVLRVTPATLLVDGVEDISERLRDGDL